MTGKPAYPLQIHVATYGSDGTTELSHPGPSLIGGACAVPRIGETLLYGRAWWRVLRVFWTLPDEAARAPVTMAILHVAKVDPQPAGCAQ